MRGRDEPMMVRIAADSTVLESFIALQQAPDIAKPQLSMAQARA